MGLINTFLFYSIIGHIVENFVYTKVDSGILYGYWTPIYGIGVLLIILIFNLICKIWKKKWMRPFWLFLFSALIIGGIEFIGGMIIEKVFGRVFWDYSSQTFNIGRYTSLKMMLIWGIASLLIIYIINPIVQKILKKIPRTFSYSLALLFMFDLVYTVVTLSKF